MGHSITVTVSYDTRSKTSPATAAAVFPALTGTVSISGASGPEGTPKSGDTLTAVTTALTSPQGDPAYQWKRDGTNIDEATNVNYEVVADDVGHTITVTVTYSGNSGSVTSAATAAVLASYTVTFNTNGGSAAPETQTVVSGGTATEPEAPTKDGNVFVHWYISNEDTAYDFGTAVSGNITLNAKWTVAYTVTFVTGDGASAVSAQNVVSGGTATAPDAPTKAGYGFVHWYVSDADTPYVFSTAVTGNITLNAKWINLNAEDFGAEATITQTFAVTDAATWATALTTIKNGGNDKNYVINVSGSFSVAGVATSDTSTCIFGAVTGIKVSLRGSGTITLSGNGSLLYVNYNQTLILRDIALVGITGNTAAVVKSCGALSMRSGTIRDNFGIGDTGGVEVSYGTFDMSGGTISGNCGVGGGVDVYHGTFTMSGGIISGNTGVGGGVFVDGTGEYPGAFTKTGGIIYGSDEGANSNSIVLYLTDHGNAVYYNYGTSSSGDDYYRDTTLGEGVGLSTTNTSSGWGQ